MVPAHEFVRYRAVVACIEFAKEGGGQQAGCSKVEHEAHQCEALCVREGDADHREDGFLCLLNVLSEVCPRLFLGDDEALLHLGAGVSDSNSPFARRVFVCSKPLAFDIQEECIEAGVGLVSYLLFLKVRGEGDERHNCERERPKSN